MNACCTGHGLPGTSKAFDYLLVYGVPSREKLQSFIESLFTALLLQSASAMAIHELMDCRHRFEMCTYRERSWVCILTGEDYLLLYRVTHNRIHL
jgi:hypothetical protein